MVEDCSICRMAKSVTDHSYEIETVVWQVEYTLL